VKEATLDLSQATQLLTWLDEEHRKDKALLMALQSQVDAQKTQLKDQARQLQEIEALLARVEGSLPKAAQLEESIQTVRTEFAGLLAKHAAQHESLEEDRAQAEQQETETLGRIIHQVQERVEALGSFEHTMQMLSEEDGKLRSEITKSISQISDLSRRAEGQQARLDLLEKDAPAMRDGLTAVRLNGEELNNRLMALKVGLDNVASPLDAKLEQLQSSLEDTNKQRASELLGIQGKQQDQARQLDGLEKELKVLQAPMARWTKQMEEFTVQFERNRKALYDLREMEKQVRQQGNEMMELQRVTADRMRTELREWQDNQVRVDEEQSARVEQIQAWQRKVNETLAGVDGRLEQNKQAVESYAERLWETWTGYMQGQVGILESILKQRRES
jgi:chromosome segregation ATPase